MAFRIPMQIIVPGLTGWNIIGAFSHNGQCAMLYSRENSYRTSTYFIDGDTYHSLAQTEHGSDFASASGMFIDTINSIKS